MQGKGCVEQGYDRRGQGREQTCVSKGTHAKAGQWTSKTLNCEGIADRSLAAARLIQAIASGAGAERGIDSLRQSFGR